MEILHSIVAVMCLHKWMASMNHFGLVAVHHQFLRFLSLDKCYQFGSLAFGLSSASCVFMKTLIPLITWLRLMGVQLNPYLDDLRILGDSPTEVTQSVKKSPSRVHS